ncbi:MAG: hypothetical protein ABIV13_06420 [Fimbriimonadales bacterium]
MSRKLHTHIGIPVLILASVSASADVLLAGDLHGDRVLSYDATTGAFLGVFADTHIDGPQGLAMDSSGNVYVASEYSSNITKWSPGGVFLGEFGAPGLAGPQDIEFGPDGNFYVNAHVPLVADSVWKFDGVTGAFLGMHGLGGGFAHTHGMSWRPSDGDLYQGLLAGPSSMVRRFDGPTGAMLTPFTMDETLAINSDILWGPDDNLYASNPLVGGFGIAGITRFDGATGAYLGLFSDLGLGGSWGMAFRDSWLYYSVGSAVVRVDAATGGTPTLFASGGGMSVATSILFMPVPEPASGVCLGLFVVGSGLLTRLHRRRLS